MGVTYLPSALAQTLAMPIYPYPYWVPQVSIEALVKLGSRSLAKQDRD
jgi:hypothetical protein